MKSFSFRLVYKWFYNVHRITYALGIIGYMIIMCTFMGFNVLLLVRPELAMSAGVLVIFYGLYYGVLGRDCAELCADKMAAKMGVSRSIMKLVHRFHFFSFNLSDIMVIETTFIISIEWRSLLSFDFS